MVSLKGIVRSTLGPNNIKRIRTAVTRTYAYRPVRFRSSVYGVPLIGDFTDATYRFALKGNYGPFVRDCIKKLDPRTTFLDIGANVGLFSVLASRQLTQGKVFSFEPNQNVFAYLVRNLRHNGCKNATSLNLAISDGPPGLASLSFASEHTGMGSLASVRGENSTLVATIGATFLDELYSPNQAYATKIDVEGHELSVLATLAKAKLFPQLQTVIVEVSDLAHGGSEGGKIEHFLTTHGFKLAAKSDDGPHRDEQYVRV